MKLSRFTRLALWIPDIEGLRAMSGSEETAPPAYIRKNRWTWKNPIRRIKEIRARASFEDILVRLEKFKSNSRSSWPVKTESEQEGVNKAWDTLALEALDCAEDFWDVGQIYASSREASKPRITAFEAYRKNKGGWSAPYQK